MPPSETSFVIYLYRYGYFGSPGGPSSGYLGQLPISAYSKVKSLQLKLKIINFDQNFTFLRKRTADLIRTPSLCTSGSQFQWIAESRIWRQSHFGGYPDCNVWAWWYRVWEFIEIVGFSTIIMKVWHLLKRFLSQYFQITSCASAVSICIANMFLADVNFPILKEMVRLPLRVVWKSRNFGVSRNQKCGTWLRKTSCKQKQILYQTETS